MIFHIKHDWLTDGTVFDWQKPLNESSAKEKNHFDQPRLCLPKRTSWKPTGLTPPPSRYRVVPLSYQTALLTHMFQDIKRSNYPLKILMFYSASKCFMNTFTSTTEEKFTEWVTVLMHYQFFIQHCSTAQPLYKMQYITTPYQYTISVYW